MICCGSPAGPSAEGPEEHSALELRAFGSHRGREELFSTEPAQTSPPCLLSVPVPELQPEVPALHGELIPKGAGATAAHPTGTGALVSAPGSLAIHAQQEVLGWNSGFCSHAIINEMREVIILHFSEPL